MTDTPGTTIPPTSTAGSSVTTTTAGAPPCLEGEQPFTDDGALATGLLDRPPGDAARVTGLEWDDHGVCGRLTVELATSGGAPATEPGGVRAELLRDLGIIRLGLDPAVSSTAIADRLIDSDLVERAYVVRSADGSLFVDLHLASAVIARAAVVRSPAAVIVDLQPGGADLPSRPAVSDLFVVTTPTVEKADYPLAVRGYGRPFEATLVVRLRKADRVDVEELTTTADYVETWGEFAVDIPDGPLGSVELFVGEDSPQDGGEKGVTVSLVMN